MKNKLICFSCLLCFYTSVIFAQLPRLKYLSVEGGMLFSDATMPDYDFIRANNPSYVYGYYNGYYERETMSSMKAISYRSFAGIKFEILSYNDRFALASGLRYSRIKSILRNDTYWSSSYFYCLLYQDATKTEYLRVNEINQKSDYLGIPIEVKYFFTKRPYVFNVYIKVGTEINYLLHSQTDVIFNNKAMDQFENGLTDRIKKPQSLYASIYSGAGIRIGRDLKPSVCIETNLPYLYIADKTRGLLESQVAYGFQINLRIPIKSAQK